MVLNDAGAVLLVRSSKRAERWELPGGQVETNESPMDACRREVFEETSVRIAELRFVGLYFGSRDGLLRITFSAQLASHAGDHFNPRATQKYASEILEAGWFRPDSLPNPMPTLARRMILAAIAGYEELTTIEDDSEFDQSFDH